MRMYLIPLTIAEAELVYSIWTPCNFDFFSDRADKLKEELVEESAFEIFTSWLKANPDLRQAGKIRYVYETSSNKLTISCKIEQKSIPLKILKDLPSSVLKGDFLGPFKTSNDGLDG